MDPFSDHAAISEEREAITESTLAVGRSATLTLGTDALIVLDDGLRDGRPACCGLLPQKSTNTRSIPYFNILWAEVTKLDITIHYATPSKPSVRVAYLHYTLDSTPGDPTKWAARLLDRAYGDAKRRKKIKVLINPFGGRGKAANLYSQEIEPIFAAAKCEVDVEKTNYKGHAVEIAQNLDIDAYDVLASASGDGLPHECVNGLAKKTNASEALRKVAVVQLPCGSGNAMSWNLTGTQDCSVAALSIVKGFRTPIDLVSITQGDRRTLSFLTQALGVVAESDLGTENIRWMGEARFTYGFLVRLLGKTIYPCDVSVKEEIVDKQEIKKHYARQRKVRHSAIDDALDGATTTSTKGLGLPPLQYGTVNDPLPNTWTRMQEYPTLGNFYCGNMGYITQDAPFFTSSLPCDGMLDLVMVDGKISRLKAVDLLLSVPKGTFFDNDLVSIRKISGVRVIPRYGTSSPSKNKDKTEKERKGFFSVDGESYPFEPFQIEVHKGLGTVISRRRGVYECPGPAGWESILVDAGGS